MPYYAYNFKKQHGLKNLISKTVLITFLTWFRKYSFIFLTPTKNFDVMKNVFQGFVFTLMGVLFIASCAKESPIQQDTFKNRSIEILTTFNKNKLDFDQGWYAQGTAHIEVKENQSLMVQFLAKDAQELNVFQFQTEKALNFNTLLLEDAEFLFLRESLVIYSLTSNQQFLFILNDAFLPKNLTLQSNVQKISGYGLAEAKISEENFPDLVSNRTGGVIAIPIDIDNVACNCVNAILIECDAGGTGATACSISSGGESCSVECGNGASACCNAEG